MMEIIVRVWSREHIYACLLYESPQILIDSLAQWKFSSFHGHLLYFYDKIDLIILCRCVIYHVNNFSEKSQFFFCFWHFGTT